MWHDVIFYLVILLWPVLLLSFPSPQRPASLFWAPATLECAFSLPSPNYRPVPQT